MEKETDDAGEDEPEELLSPEEFDGNEGHVDKEVEVEDDAEGYI